MLALFGLFGLWPEYPCFNFEDVFIDADEIGDSSEISFLGKQDE